MKNKLITLLVFHLELAAVMAQPVITNQPQNQTAIAGRTVRFSVGATGMPPLAYQWRSHANATSFTNIPFGTETTLVLTNVQPTTRRYGVVVTDAGGLSVTSNPLVTLTVLVPPGIALQPTNQLAEVGDPVTFTAVASGTAPLAYQWRHNEIDLSGKTSTNLVLTSVQLTNAGNYALIVTNIVGAATSQVAVLTVPPAVFTKITDGAIVNDGGASIGCAWGDYDDDGWLDLFVTNAERQRNFLYHNERNGGFSAVTNGEVVNVARDWRGIAWGDYDNDGFPDLFVGSIGGGVNALFHNFNGIFVGITSGPIAGVSAVTQGAAWGDYNNDGLLDLLVPNGVIQGVPNQPNFLYRNDGGGAFTRVNAGELTTQIGEHPNCAWGDYDNDGYLDIFLCHRSNQNNSLYRNNGDGIFSRITRGELVRDGGDSVGRSWGEYNNDGFLDLFVANGAHVNQNNFLYRNNGNTNHWLEVRLRGTVSNRSAIGAKVRVRAMIRGNVMWQLREISNGDGANGNSLIAHFGLGDATNIDTVRIEWPSGTAQELHDVAVNRFVVVTEPPRLAVRADSPHDAVTMEVTCWPGFNLSIERSTDLRTWQAWRTLTTTNRTTRVDDPIVPATQAQFYRAAMP